MGSGKSAALTTHVPAESERLGGEWVRPPVSYMICATLRSGSSLLDEAMTRTAIAGRPNEFFWTGHEETLSKRCGTSNYNGFLSAAVRVGSTENGVFGFKIMGSHLSGFAERLASVSESGVTEPHALIAERFGSIHHIWITRRDKIRQAVSLERASQSGDWALDGRDPANQPVEYKGEAIDWCVGNIVQQEATWSDYFHAADVTPHCVVYEDFVRDIEGTIRSVLEFLGIVPDGPLFKSPGKMRRQSDSISEDWVRRYLEDYRRILT